jgi:hypothetical protein
LAYGRLGKRALRRWCEEVCAARRRMVFRAVCGADWRKEEGEAAVWGGWEVAAPPVPNSRLVQAGTEEGLAEGHIPAGERLRLGIWQARRGVTPAGGVRAVSGGTRGPTSHCRTPGPPDGQGCEGVV